MRNPRGLFASVWPIDPDDPFYDRFPSSHRVVELLYLEDGDTLTPLDDRELSAASEALIDSAKLELVHGGSNDIICFLRSHRPAVMDLVKAGSRYDAVCSFYAYWKSKLAEAYGHT